MAEYMVGGQSPAPVFGYIPGIPVVIRVLSIARRLLRRNPATIGGLGIIVIGDYAKKLISGIPHQGPQQFGPDYYRDPKTGRIRKHGDDVLPEREGPAGAEPGDVVMPPVWRADP